MPLSPAMAVYQHSKHHTHRQLSLSQVPTHVVMSYYHLVSVDVDYICLPTSERQNALIGRQMALRVVFRMQKLS